MSDQPHFPTSSQFGHDPLLPVDDPAAWPDLSHRDLTPDEREAMRQKAIELTELVLTWEQVAYDQHPDRTDPSLAERNKQRNYIAGMIISSSLMSLHAAHGLLEDRSADESVVAHLRTAETLIRLLLTWQGAPAAAVVEALFKPKRNSKIPSEGQPLTPGATVLNDPENNPSSELELPDVDYFGGCPECTLNNGYLNIVRSHWMICHAHKTKWLFGHNLFSSWRDESTEVWEENYRLLATYREVEPLMSSTWVPQRPTLD